MEVSIGGRRCVPVVQLDSPAVDPWIGEGDMAAIPALRGAPIYRGIDILVFIRLTADSTRAGKRWIVPFWRRRRFSWYMPCRDPGPNRARAGQVWEDWLSKQIPVKNSA